MRYAAQADRTIRISTALAVAILLGVPAAVFVLGRPAEPGSALLLGAAVALLSVTIVGVSWALAPKGFAIEGARLVVERPLWPVRIALADVRGACLLPDRGLRGALRVGGNGGLFGVYGWFWSRTLGGFRAYATRMGGLVLVDTAAERLVLSPEPAERFLDELLDRAPRAVRVDAAALARRPLPRRVWRPLAAALSLVLVVVGAVAFGAYALAPERVVVDALAVRVERRAAPDVVIPLAEVGGARLVGCAELGRVRRVSGYASGGVAYGRFRSSALGEFRLYESGPGPWVLLDTRDGPVVVTPEDPDAFLASVRAGLPAR